MTTTTDTRRDTLTVQAIEDTINAGPDSFRTSFAPDAPLHPFVIACTGWCTPDPLQVHTYYVGVPKSEPAEAASIDDRWASYQAHFAEGTHWLGAARLALQGGRYVVTESIGAVAA